MSGKKTYKTHIVIICLLIALMPMFAGRVAFAENDGTTGEGGAAASGEQHAEEPKEEPGPESNTGDGTEEQARTEQNGDDELQEEEDQRDPSENPGGDGSDGQADKPDDGTSFDDSVFTAEDGKPVIKSAAALVYCRNTGETICAKGTEKKLSPLGLTKLMTALLAAQKLPLDQDITVSAAAASQDSPKLGLVEGETVSAERLLYALMLQSSNDAAYALAESISGTEADFVALMNSTAANIGCRNTWFAGITGTVTDVSAEYTTAKDMLEIAKLAYGNETLLKIAGTDSYEMPATNMSDARQLTQTVTLVTDGRDGYAGGCMGYASDSRMNLSMYYRQNGLDLITIVLGAKTVRVNAETDTLIDYAAANVNGITVVKAGRNMGKARVGHGAETRVDVLTSQDCIVYLPRQGSKDLIRTETVINTDVEAPVKAGDVVGKCRIYVADELVNEIDLVAGSDVETGWLPSYIGISNRASVIASVVIFLVLLLLLVRNINIARSRRRRRRLRRDKALEIARHELEEEQRRRKRR